MALTRFTEPELGEILRFLRAQYPLVKVFGSGVIAAVHDNLTYGKARIIVGVNLVSYDDSY